MLHGEEPGGDDRLCPDTRSSSLDAPILLSKPAEDISSESPLESIGPQSHVCAQLTERFTWAHAYDMSTNHIVIAIAEAAQCQPAGFTAAQPQGTDARTWWRSWAARAAATPFLPTGLVQALSTTAATTAASTADTAKGTAKEIASFKPISVMGEWFYCGGDSSDWDGLLD